jgi:hypothetical protein
MDAVREWQDHPLKKSYANMYLDAIRVKAKEEEKSCGNSIYAVRYTNAREPKFPPNRRITSCVQFKEFASIKT